MPGAEQHQEYLLQALAQAEQRRGFCAPNPAVGTVVVKDGVVLAQGCHWAAGQAHAEVDALNKLTTEQCRGATIYVTLEPCCHHGKTPPCVDLLIERQLAAVYYAYQDPNPIVAGKGRQQLQAAGIGCEHIPVAVIDQFYQSYHYWTSTKLPVVTAKIAMSLDGKIAGRDGAPIKLTGAEAQQLTHAWRKRSDAILTTSKTIICDNPQLNVRLASATIAKPLYILDTRLDLPPTATVFATTAAITAFHATTADPQRQAHLLELGVRCVPITTKNGKLAFSEVLRQIGADGVHDLWVEAGGTCFQALFEEGWLNRALIYTAPKWLGAAAKDAFSKEIAFTQLAATITWQALGADGVCELVFDKNICGIK